MEGNELKNKLIEAARKFCRETYDMTEDREEYYEKFGVLICFIEDVLIPMIELDEEKMAEILYNGDRTYNANGKTREVEWKDVPENTMARMNYRMLAHNLAVKPEEIIKVKK